jgi:hypothetical protein
VKVPPTSIPSQSMPYLTTPFSARTRTVSIDVFAVGQPVWRVG